MLQPSLSSPPNDTTQPSSSPVMPSTLSSSHQPSPSSSPAISSQPHPSSLPSHAPLSSSAASTISHMSHLDEEEMLDNRRPIRELLIQQIHDDTHDSDGISIEPDDGRQHDIFSTNKYSNWSYAFLISLVIWEMAAGIIYWPFALTFPFYFTPCLALYHWYTHHSDVLSLDHLIRALARGFYPFAISLVSCEYGILYIMMIAAGERYHIIVAIIWSWGIAVIPEELLKYYYASAPVSQRDAIRTSKANLVETMAVATGFAIGTTLIFTIFFTLLVRSASVGNISTVSIGFVISIMLLSVIFVVPLHVLTAYMIGLKLALRSTRPDVPHEPIWRIIAPAVAARGLMLFLLSYLTTLAISFPVYLVLQLVFCVLIILPLLLYIRIIERQLPASYLTSMGALNLAGYGMLGSGEMDRELADVDAEAEGMVP